MALGLTIHILGSAAEHKAEMLSSRAKAALVAAKARGVKLGGDKGKIGFKAMLGAKARALGARSQSAEAEQPVIQAIRAEGASTLRKVASKRMRGNCQSERRKILCEAS
jgi:DNA invertase Pin-like site-specific DNA recombinase